MLLDDLTVLSLAFRAFVVPDAMVMFVDTQSSCRSYPHYPGEW
jgi:hypothetical protein